MAIFENQTEALSIAILQALLADTTLRTIMCYDEKLNIAKSATRVAAKDPFLGYQLRGVPYDADVPALGTVFDVTFCIWSGDEVCQSRIVDRLLYLLGGNEESLPRGGCGGGCYWDISVPGWVSRDVKFLRLRRPDAYDKEIDQSHVRLEAMVHWIAGYCQGSVFTPCPEDVPV